MKWFKWLFDDNDTVKIEETSCCDDMGTKDCCKDEEADIACCDNTGTDDCCQVKDEGFVDEKTGKVYKTASALKSVQTRRKNAKAKMRKK